MIKYYPKLSFIFIFILIALLCVVLSKGKWILAKYESWLYQPLPTVSAGGFQLPGSYFEVSISSEKSDHYTQLQANFRLWIPESSEKIRGLIVKQHGCGDGAADTGLDHANDLQWQALAAKHRFALLGTKQTSINKICEDWALMNNGSKNLFLKALHAFAEKSKRLELEDVPWVLWGHSGGADWAAQMFQEYPNRTIALVGVRSGGFEFFGTNPSLVGVPVLFALGEKDPYAETIKLSQQAFSRYRNIDAPWTIVIEPNAAHETANSRFLIIPYLDAVITSRLTKSGNQLQQIKVADGWLGNPVSHAIAPIDRYSDNPLNAVWLPNEEIAHKWQEYVTQGRVTPSRKPNAPIEVRAKKGMKNEVVLTWNYPPDLENGLPSFRIYRNNILVQTIKGQIGNFGDAAYPPNVVLEFRDKNATLNSKYTIAAFNILGENVSQSTQLSF